MEGIVLKRINYEETSYILNVITKEKYMSLIVKGAKRKNSLKLGISEPLTLIDFVPSKSVKMPTLIEGVVINEYSNLKCDLVKLAIASVMLEYVYSIRDLDLYFENIFDLLKESLSSIDELGENALFRFESILLKELGSSMKEEFLMENYDYYQELKPSLEELFKEEEIKNKDVLRKFFSDYYLKELGIKIKSKKMYLELI